MLFNSHQYVWFLFAAYLVFWGLKGAHHARTLFLVVASYVFYVAGTYETALEQAPPLGPVGWSVLCFGIIFVGSSLDFWIGRLMGRIEDKRKRLALLLVSIVYYLGVLALFKYWNFAVDNVSALAKYFGVSIAPHHTKLILPFGISFFTFETMSYTIDVYRKELAPAKSYKEYLLFVAFFPHLVAGPIVRPQQMLPQLEADPVFDSDKQMAGLFRIGVGLFKKIVIGDILAANLVGRVFDNPERFSSLEVLVGVYAYAMQIYNDFSGYSDIAIGSAALFGYELPENFETPYRSRNLQEFWRKWHITLSSWLRDYLYIPLGGSKGSTLFTYRNLFLTMLLGGLWHGASWNFVIWGALHGGALAVVRIFQRWQEGRKDPIRMGAIAGTVLTFHYVCFAWIFFRAKDFSHATHLIARFGEGTLSSPNLSTRVLVTLAIAFVMHWAPKTWLHSAVGTFSKGSAVRAGLAIAAFALILHRFAAQTTEPFVYGQF